MQGRSAHDSYRFLHAGRAALSLMEAGIGGVASARSVTCEPKGMIFSGLNCRATRCASFRISVAVAIARSPPPHWAAGYASSRRRAVELQILGGSIIAYPPFD